MQAEVYIIENVQCFCDDCGLALQATEWRGCSGVATEVACQCFLLLLSLLNGQVHLGDDLFYDRLR